VLSSNPPQLKKCLKPPQPSRVTDFYRHAERDHRKNVRRHGTLPRRVDRGHDLETLVYTRDRGKEVIVISFEDGKVSSAYSSRGTPSPRSRPDEHTTDLLARPSETQPVSIAMPPAAEGPKTMPKVLDNTLAQVPTATKPPAGPSAQGNGGTCGEYRDGKLTVKPCSQVSPSTSDWLAKGSGVAPGESASGGSRVAGN